MTATATATANNTAATMAYAGKTDRRAIRVAVTSVVSALCVLMLTGIVAGHQPAAATAPAQASAAWTLGAWGDTTVPAAMFSSSDSAEPIAPTF